MSVVVMYEQRQIKKKKKNYECPRAKGDMGIRYTLGLFLNVIK
jgi:hypothetical protein